MFEPDRIDIESDRLFIKPFSAADANEAFSCITLSLTRFMSWEPPANSESFTLIWQAWLSTMAKGIELILTIRQRDNEMFLGLIGLHHIESENPELGIWIREDRHREGLGKEAVSCVAEWASRELGIECFIYPVAEANYASRRIAESLGGEISGECETPKFKSVIYRISGACNRR
jgi:RimJ/RimL family protein N-acetyltransferase